jgi:hypothetical protein
MKKVLLVVMVLILAVYALALSPAQIAAFDSCELAAAAGWHHPGLNGWCITDIVMQLIFDGVLNPEDWY